MPQEVNEIGMPIPKVHNEYRRGNPKDVLHHLDPRPAPRNRRRSWRRWPRAGVVLEVVTAGGVALAMPLPHESTTNWRPTGHLIDSPKNPKKKKNPISPQNQQPPTPTKNRPKTYRKILRMSPHNHKPALKLRARLRKTQFNKRSRSISIARGASPIPGTTRCPEKPATQEQEPKRVQDQPKNQPNRLQILDLYTKNSPIDAPNGAQFELGLHLLVQVIE